MLMTKQPDKFGKVVEDSQRKRPHQNMVERCEEVLRREHEGVVRAVKRLRKNVDTGTVPATLSSRSGYLWALSDVLALLEKRRKV